MQRRSAASAVASVLAATLLLPAAAQANVALPTLFYGLGGAAVTALMTLLAAVIERPFVTRAGVARLALLHSLLANVLSGSIGILAIALLEAIDLPEPDSLDLTMFLLLAIGLLISIVVEGLYYWLLRRRAGGLRWRWVALGNVVSLLVLVVLHYLLPILLGA